MDSTIIVALIVGIFGFLGAFLNSKFTANIRVVKLEMNLSSLEKEMKKHNGVMERTYQLENRLCVVETELDNINHNKRDKGAI